MEGSTSNPELAAVFQEGEGCTPDQARMLEEFRQKAKSLGYEFFALVADPDNGTGASVFGTVDASRPDSPARHARNAHMSWETDHGIDPHHSRDDALIMEH
jgi:hypothetical protein